jgi:hypothetical protein
MTKWVYQRQEPLVIPSLDREKRFARMIAFLNEKGFQSVCALPLMTVHRRIGSIAVASKRAASLGLKQSTLQARMEKLGIRRPRAAAASQNSR